MNQIPLLPLFTYTQPRWIHYLKKVSDVEKDNTISGDKTNTNTKIKDDLIKNAYDLSRQMRSELDVMDEKVESVSIKLDNLLTMLGRNAGESSPVSAGRRYLNNDRLEGRGRDGPGGGAGDEDGAGGGAGVGGVVSGGGEQGRVVEEGSFSLANPSDYE